MDRWVSRSPSGRRTSARSRCFSSAISTCSSANRGSSCPTGSTSTGSSVTSFSGDRRSSPGTVGTFDDLFSLLAGVDPRGGGVASEVQRTARCAAGHRAGSPRRPRGVRLDRGLRGHAAADHRRARVGAGRPRLARSRALRARGRLSQRARGARLARSRRHAAPGGRAASRRSRSVVGRACLRLWLRGSDRHRVGTARVTRGTG